MRSLAALHDDLELVTLLVDRIDGAFDPADEPFEILLAEELSIPGWKHFSMKYDILELNTAVKPFLLESLAERFDARNVIYLDPDIVVYRRLDPLLRELEEHDVVLTPHILGPIDDGKSPSELDFLRVGTYNLGFFALARRGRWRELLEWWQAKVYSDCTAEPERGLFVDQHWMDLVPSLFDNVRILRDPGYNVAYWNYKNRDVQACSDGYQVNGSPLVFMHFSGFSVENMERVSKHQSRFVLSDLNEHIRALFVDYRERLLAEGYETCRQWSYAYGRFSDGPPISKPLRICLRKHDPEGERWPDPYELEGSYAFRRWATTPGSTDRFRLLSPYLLTLHELHPDLQSRYALQHVAKDVAKWFERDFARWFVRQEGTTSIFHPVYVEPVKQALALADTSDVAVESPLSRDSGPGASPLGRFVATARYFKAYPREIAPFVHPLSVDISPEIYTGPGGLYGWLRRRLIALGLQQRAKKLLGMRLLLTTRFFFSFPNPGELPLPDGLTSLGVQRPEWTRRSTPTSVPTPESDAATSTDSRRGLNVVGYTRSETGVGQVARSLLGCLADSDYPVAKHTLEAHDLSRKEDRSADHIEEGLPHDITVFNVNADSTEAIRALLGPEAYRGHYNIGYWFWELSRFPERWRRSFDPYDEIWVASSFIHAAVSEWSPVPVVRMPVGIEVALPEGATRSSLGLPEAGFLVLYVFDALSVLERKNPWGAIAAFERAFRKKERERDVRLVVKVTSLERAAPEDASRLRREVARVDGILIDRYLDRLQVNALIDHCDVYFSPHRSEGFGLTIAEAMYLGKPVLATAYSAPMDFMTPSNSLLLPYRLVELERDYPPYERGSVWAEPDIDAAASMLRELYEHPVQGRERGRVAASDIRRDFAPRTVANKIIARLELIGARATGNEGST